MDIFMKLANVNSDNAGSIIEAVRQLVLDEAGQPVLTADSMLPTKVMMRVLTKVVESLGK
jgi:hypothetical protein